MGQELNRTAGNGFSFLPVLRGEQFEPVYMWKRTLPERGQVDPITTAQKEHLLFQGLGPQPRAKESLCTLGAYPLE